VERLSALESAIRATTDIREQAEPSPGGVMLIVTEGHGR
jgi:hypothetical protein